MGALVPVMDIPSFEVEAVAFPPYGTELTERLCSGGVLPNTAHVTPLVQSSLHELAAFIKITDWSYDSLNTTV